MANRVAPTGHVYVCMACGKMSKDLYGFQPISKGWDVSCSMNAILVKEAEVMAMQQEGRKLRKKLSGKGRKR